MVQIIRNMLEDALADRRQTIITVLSCLCMTAVGVCAVGGLFGAAFIENDAARITLFVVFGIIAGVMVLNAISGIALHAQMTRVLALMDNAKVNNNIIVPPPPPAANSV